MKEKKMYGEMVIYLDGSEAASMFEGILPDDIKIMGVSSSASNEDSFATYCYPDDVVNGTHIGTCLGDEFSANWLEDTESSDPKKETLDM